MSEPVRYSSAVETPEADEDKTFAELRETLLKIANTTWHDEQEPLRAVHAKGHGLLKATLTVINNLPEPLAQGLFALPGPFDVLMRFSTSPGDLLPDSVSTPRGLAIKVLDVPGERLPGGYGDGAQDFLLVNGKAFGAPNPKKFLGNLKLLAGTTDKAEGLKVALSAALQATEELVESLGGESGLLNSLGGHPPFHPLGESYFSQVPLRHGGYIAKLGLVPVSPELKALEKIKLDTGAEFDALRQAIRNHFMVHGGVWELQAQLNTDLEKMPIENAQVAWPEDQSPYVTIARIEAKPQESWSDELRQRVDIAAAFSPWNGIVAHQPLGGVMRARRTVYPALAGLRLERSGCPFHHAAE
ncbi:MAG: catalase [Alphaproteobacteria bacterium]|nr:catalase [Alphaproteobacteria bacterium]